MANVKTFYKPTQWRGKKVVFASIDPEERKRQTVIGWVAVSIVFTFIVIAGLVVSLSN